MTVPLALVWWRCKLIKQLLWMSLKILKRVWETQNLSDSCRIMDSLIFSKAIVQHFRSLHQAEWPIVIVNVREELQLLRLQQQLARPLHDLPQLLVPILWVDILFYFAWFKIIYWPINQTNISSIVIRVNGIFTLNYCWVTYDDGFLLSMMMTTGFYFIFFFANYFNFSVEEKEAVLSAVLTVKNFLNYFFFH